MPSIVGHFCGFALAKGILRIAIEVAGIDQAQTTQKNFHANEIYFEGDSSER